MNRDLLEPDKKNPLNEQTLRKRYPNVSFGYAPPSLANLTLKELIKRIPKDEKLTMNDYSESSSILTFIRREHNAEQLRCDFLIEAAKYDHYSLVEWVIINHIVKVTKDVVEKHINSIIIDSARPISGLDLGNPNTLEIMLCAQDTPTELLEIISGQTNRITSFRQYTNQCTGLFLNAYLTHCIVRNLEKANGNHRGTIYELSDENRKKYIGKAIDHLKFLCEIIENYFPNSKHKRVLQDAAFFCGKYENMIYQYHPRVRQELPLLFNSAQSVEQDKGNAPTMSSKPTF